MDETPGMYRKPLHRGPVSWQCSNWKNTMDPEIEKYERQAAIAEMFGHVSYEAFMQTQGGRDAYGAEAPMWPDLDEHLKVGWRVAGVSVVNFHERARMEQVKQDGYAGILNDQLVDRRIHRTAIPLKQDDANHVRAPRSLPH